MSKCQRDTENIIAMHGDLCFDVIGKVWRKLEMGAFIIMLFIVIYRSAKCAIYNYIRTAGMISLPFSKNKKIK